MSHTEAAVAKIISRAKGIHLSRIYQLMQRPDFNRARHRRQTTELFRQFDAYEQRLRRSTAHIDFDDLNALLDQAGETDENHLSLVLARIEAILVVPVIATRSMGDSDPFGAGEDVEDAEEAAEEEEDEVTAAEAATLPPLVREILGLLQTQSALVSNRFEELLKQGASLSRPEFLKRFNPLSFLTSCYQKALRNQTATVTSAELDEYKQLRDFAITAEEATFFDDLVTLHDFIADRIGADHALA